MKIAFDENTPAAMVRVFRGFSGEKALKKLGGGDGIAQAQDYYPDESDPDFSRKDDAPWIRRFAADGGKLIISGDVKMNKRPHERLALLQTGMCTIYFTSQWGSWKFCRKCSLLMHWWPVILEMAENPIPGFFRVPLNWPAEGEGRLEPIPPEELAFDRIQRQIAARPTIQRARKAKREGNTASGDLFDGQARQDQ